MKTKWSSTEVIIAIFLVAMLVILLGGVGLIAWNWNPTVGQGA